jgi:hypothetical protein
MADGLGTAYLLGTLCISFLSHNLWDSNEIRNIEHWFLKENGNEITEIIAVKHASKPAHLAKHKAWFEQKKEKVSKKVKIYGNEEKNFFLIWFYVVKLKNN